MLRYIDGIVQLSVPLYVQPDLLGTELSIRIGNYTGKIGFPSMPDSGFPPPGGVTFLRPAALRSRSVPDTTLVAMKYSRWGYIGISSGQAFVETVQIRIPIGEPDGFVPDQMSATGREFDKWYNVVRDWACAWSGQVRHREFDHEESRIHATIRVDGRANLYGSGLTVGHAIIGETAATREQVEAAFYCASRGYNLPLQHSLLQRAISDFSKGNFRLAVINACTAAEVSLGAAVREKLQSANVNENTVKNIMKQSSGAVEIFRLFIVAGGKISISDNRVMDQLARPRNEAVHAGISSSNTDAQRAIDTAKEIVKAAAPLQDRVSAKRSARKLTNLRQSHV